MTIAFSTIQAAIKTWAEGQTGLTAHWLNEQLGLIFKPRIRLSITASRDLGVDDLRYNVDGGQPAGSDYVPTISGNRLLTLSILVESRDQTPSGAARYYLERLRTSLHKPSVRAAFLAADLAYVQSEPIINLDEVVDMRMESRASMDVQLATVVNETDIAEGISYTEDIVSTGTGYDDSGDPTGWVDVTLGKNG